ncbi:hypothetical protein ACFVFS_22105 [Kitasatospora sp. NPDC057692]|uniref:hypothetical protein n=1 Tax=Kitasatospora sp. NPDC057692 TaxID=3346215 RepID=UPI0036BE117A
MTVASAPRTAPGSDPHGLATLPGVRLWIRRVAKDLAAGHSCLLLVPAAMPDSAALLPGILTTQPRWLRVPPPGAPSAPGEPEPDEPEPEPEPLWSAQPPVLDIDDSFLTGIMASVFGADPVAAPDPAPRLPLPRVAPDRVRDVEARLESLLPSESTRSVYDRLTSDHADGCVYVLDAADEKDPEALAQLLLRLPASAKAAGLAPDQRPRLLVIATPDDLPPAYPDRLTGEDVAVHWWWGATGRLDTASVTAVNRPLRARAALTGRHRIEEVLVQATIVEVCGPHLDLAAALARLWDGRPESLPAALNGAYAATRVPVPLPGDSPTPVQHSGGLAQQPPAALVLRWNAGAVDSWDGHLRPHPATASGRTLDKLIWLAQNRTLLPLIDDAREALATRVLPTATLPADQMLAVYGTDRATPTDTSTTERLHSLELGQLATAKSDGRLRFTSAQATTLFTLRNARNCLSHREHLGGATLHRLFEQLSLDQ